VTTEVGLLVAHWSEEFMMLNTILELEEEGISWNLAAVVSNVPGTKKRYEVAKRVWGPHAGSLRTFESWLKRPYEIVFMQDPILDRWHSSTMQMAFEKIMNHYTMMEWKIPTIFGTTISSHMIPSEELESVMSIPITANYKMFERYNLQKLDPRSIGARGEEWRLLWGDPLISTWW